MDYTHGAQINEYNELYLEVTTTTVEEGVALKKKNGTVSVTKEVAEMFGLQPRQDVFIRHVEPASVAVELVELVFKEQYIGRSDMWRLSSNLINRCVYKKKYLRSSGVRASVEELWAGGKQVMCGRIDVNTKIVFRSGSSQVFILIQISPEMFGAEEESGLLMYEKAVDGFLAELFERWSGRSCAHDCSIILFARMYVVKQEYTSESEKKSMPTIESFPPALRAALNETDDGRFYFDSYVTAAEGDGCNNMNLADIKRDILSFKELLKVPHVAAQFSDTLASRSQRHGPCGPGSFAAEVTAELSNAELVEAAKRLYNDCTFTVASAQDGNIMEAINLSLSAYATHFIDRSFERTGQLIIAITAGTGVFKVSPSFAGFTKQRVVDNGVGVDIICMSQPPLHLVPLLTNSKSEFVCNPYWLRQSFYSNTSQMHGHHKYRPAKFVPRVVGAPPLGSLLGNKSDRRTLSRPITSSSLTSDQRSHKEVESNINGREIRQIQHRAHFQGDKLPTQVPETSNVLPETKSTKEIHRRHDEAIFTPYKPAPSPYYPQGIGLSGNHLKLGTAGGLSMYGISNSQIDVGAGNGKLSVNNNSESGLFKMDEINGIYSQQSLSTSPTMTSIRAQNLPTPNTPQTPQTPRALHTKNASMYHTMPLVSGSVGTLALKVPPTASTPITMVNRRVEPLQPDASHSWGHAQATPIPIIASAMENMYIVNRIKNKTHSYNSSHDVPSSIAIDRKSSDPNSFWWGSGSRHLDPFRPSTYTASKLSYSRRRWSHLDHLTMTGRRHITHGLNWKGLCVPACLPLTTDYFPSQEELSTRFRVKPYVVTVNDDDESGGSDIATHSRKVLREMVSQRLAQGFQIVVKPRTKLAGAVVGGGSIASKTYSVMPSEKNEEYMLSWGHRYHVLSYDPTDNNIEIKCYTKIPESKIPEQCAEGFQYCYRLWPLAHQCFQDVTIPFTVDAQSTGDSNWNMMDHMILGYVEKEHMSTMRHINFWRTRFCLLPVDSRRPGDLNSEAEALSKEALRVSNFQRFNKLVNSLGDVNMPDIRIVPFKTTASNIVEATGRHKLASATDMMAICKAAQAPDSGLPIGTRRLHLRVHRRCFVGNVFVDWLLKQVASVTTREDAVNLAQALVDAQLVSSCTWSQTDFRDDYSFYRFDKNTNSTSFEALSTEPMTDLWMSECVVYDRTKDRKINSHNDNHDDKGKSKRRTGASGSGGVGGPSEGRSAGVVTVSGRSSGASTGNTLITETKPNPDRLQAGWVVIHFDKTYNPLRPYHVEFHWLVSSAVMMDELMQLLHRKARGCKFRFVPVPVAPTLYRRANVNPLQAPIFVPLAVPDSLLVDKDREGEGEDESGGMAEAEDLKTTQTQLHQDKDRDVEQLEEVGGGSNLYDFMAIILSKFNFVVDVEADSRNKDALLGVIPKRTYSPPVYSCSQWVHNTGISLVQVRDEEHPPGFLWMANHLLTSKWRRAGAMGGEQFSQYEILQEFELFCRSKERVQALFMEVNEVNVDDSVCSEPPDMNHNRTPFPTLDVSGSVTSGSVTDNDASIVVTTS
eukprot:CFRG2687T1